MIVDKGENDDEDEKKNIMNMTVMMIDMIMIVIMTAIRIMRDFLLPYVWKRMGKRTHEEEDIDESCMNRLL